MNPYRTVLAAMATAATAAVLVATPAQADSETIRDARRDVTTASPMRAPGDATLDVVRARATHQGRFLTLATTVRNLAGDRNYDLYWQVETPDGGGFAVYSRFEGESSTTLYFGPSLSCRVPFDVAGRTDTVTMRVPRRCLGDPRWVRVGSGSGSTTSGPPTVGRSSYGVVGDPSRGDDARLDGRWTPFTATVGERLRVG